MISKNPIARMMAPTGEPDPQATRRIAKRAWHEHGIVIVLPGDCQGLDRQFVEGVAVRLHGRRAG